MKGCRRCLGVPPLDGTSSRCNGTGYACHAPNVTEEQANGWRDRMLCNSLMCERDAVHPAHDGLTSTPAWEMVTYHNSHAMLIEQAARRLGPVT